MFELNTIMRQLDGRIFAGVLNRVREGHHSPDDLDLLRTRTISTDSPDYPVSAQHLFRTNAEVATHNISDFEQSAQEKYIIQSVDTVLGAVSDDMAAHILTMIPANAHKTMQLAARLPLAVGCRYELCVNINGLANGAAGVIKRIQLSSYNSLNGYCLTTSMLTLRPVLTVEHCTHQALTHSGHQFGH